MPKQKARPTVRTGRATVLQKPAWLVRGTEVVREQDSGNGC